ncbi:hypothetical protein [Nocardia fluminea]|uniref:hypothetical protein n=1 Tax=Nocardia fluminea TaxID=134984 RepID=UPI003D0F7709
MSLDIDPARMREMANDARRNADAVEAITPIAGEQHLNARRYMDGSDLAVKLQETLQALDLVTKYHASMIRNFCTDTDYVANVQEELDKSIGSAINSAEGQIR